MCNPILLTDSYKLSHWAQYPANTNHIYSYFESRGTNRLELKNVVFFGLQYFIKKYLAGPVLTQAHIDEAAELAHAHFGGHPVFNKAGWESLLKKHHGKLPVEIKSVPEGMVTNHSNALFTVVNTDPEFFWLPGHLETLLSQVWYTCTVATQSAAFRKLIYNHLVNSSDKPLVDFSLHDFGFRGVSSVETAGLGGAAHLLSFSGTDNLAALTLLKDYYHSPYASCQAFSIGAMEHSTVCSWGKGADKQGEIAAYKNMLEQFPGSTVAVVSDSYNIHEALTDIWGGALKEMVQTRAGGVVVRLDSGVPSIGVMNALTRLGAAYGTTRNKKGFKVLPPCIRIIQGDGIDYPEVENILGSMRAGGWSAENVVFGSGGALLQKLNRDTMKFAYKCSAAMVNGKWRDVFKEPVDAPTKVSKKGLLALVRADTSTGGGYHTITVDEAARGNKENLLRTVFLNGRLVVDETFDVIKERFNG